MTKKVTLPRDVAEALEELRESGRSNIDIVWKSCEPIVNGTYMKIKRWAFCEEGGSADELMSALVNGYEIEQSPEDRLREYYVYQEQSYHDNVGTERIEHLAKGVAIRTTLAILGIQIEGINAGGDS